MKIPKPDQSDVKILVAQLKLRAADLRGQLAARGTTVQAPTLSAGDDLGSAELLSTHISELEQRLGRSAPARADDKDKPSGSDKNCEKCSGSGYCKACEGTGNEGAKPRSASNSCPECNGSGKCNGCSGTGKAANKTGAKAHFDPDAQVLKARGAKTLVELNALGETDAAKD